MPIRQLERLFTSLERYCFFPFLFDLSTRRISQRTREQILLAAVTLLIVLGGAQAQEGKLGVTVDVTYLSRYLFRGFDLYPDDHSAIQSSIDIDFYGTGFGLNVLSSRANRSGFEESEELDITLRYRNNLFEDKRYLTSYELAWVYYSYPDRPRKGVDVNPFATIPVVETLADVQEVHMALVWPKILGVKGLVPFYALVHIWPAQSNSQGTDNGGWVHAFGFDYWVPLKVLHTDLPQQQFLKLHSEVHYNSGVGATGMVEHDWSHAIFGLSTEFRLNENLSFEPGIYHQLSMEDSVNEEDEFWYSLSVRYKF